MKRIILAVFLVVAGGHQILAQCVQGNCQSAGHHARQTSAWPYSEDIAGTGSTPITVGYNSSLAWTTILTGCAQLNGENLFASSTFHALLRAQPTALNITLPVGTQWESQLLLKKASDPSYEVIAAWDQRRIRGTGSNYRQVEHFGNTIRNLPAGSYSFQHRVRIIDNVAGTMTFENQWTTGLGIPTSYPADGATQVTQKQVSTTWVAVGPVLTMPANSQALDLTAIASGKILSGTAGAGLQIGVSVDGQSSGTRNGQITIRSQSEGFTAFDYWINVAPNQQHTVQMWMRTTSGTATIENPTLHYIAYPNARPGSEPLDESEIRTTYASAVETTTKRVSTTSTEQPIAPPLVSICGPWTKLASFEIPGRQEEGDTETDMTALISGYIQFLGNNVGVPRGELAIEVVHYALDGTVHASAELGVSALWAEGADGMYFSTDGIWANYGLRNVVTLWARQITCVGQTNNQGGFDVGKRYLSLKFLPSPGCTYP